MSRPMTPGQKWSTAAFTGSLALLLLMALLAVVAVIASGCAPVRPPQGPTPPAQATPRVLVATVRTPDGTVVQAGTATLSDDFGHIVPCVWALDRLTCTPAEIIQPGWQAYLRISGVPDMASYSRTFLLAFDAVQDIGEIHLDADHYDPSGVPLEQLARFRGSLFTARAPLSQGPRPYQPTNVISTVRAWDWWTEQDWQVAVAALRARGYTHIAVGPLTGDDCYHGVYSPCRNELTEEARDRFLDFVQRLWDSGLAPVYRHKPDNWETGHDAELERLDELMSTPRAQRLLRIVTYPGWEPNGGSGPDAVARKYGWTNATYVAMLSRGARVFPTALRTLHTTCDTEVPVGGDSEDRALVNGAAGFAQAWKNILPYFHLWEQQVCGYLDGGYEIPREPFVGELTWVLRNQPPRTRPGGAWFGGRTAWGDNRGLVWVLSEYGSYRHFWSDWNEQGALDIGDLAMQHGADGYFDGGRVAVGSGPVPWQVGR